MFYSQIYQYFALRFQGFVLHAEPFHIQNYFLKNSPMFSPTAFTVILFSLSGIYSDVNEIVIYLYFFSKWLLNCSVILTDYSM